MAAQNDYEIKVAIRPLRYAIRDQNIELIKRIIRNKNLDINELHLHPERYLFYVGSSEAVEAYVVSKRMDIFFAFVECGLDLDNMAIMDLYFFYAIEYNEILSFRILIERVGKDRFRRLVRNPDAPETHISIFFYALEKGNVAMVHEFIVNGVNHNAPVQANGRQIFPLCIAIAKSHVPLLRYLLNLHGTNVFIDQCNIGPNPDFAGIYDDTSVNVASRINHRAVVEMYSNALENVFAYELTLERRAFLQAVVSEENMDVIPKYIQSLNYEWLMKTQARSSLIFQAKDKFIRYEHRKRQREI